MGRKVIDFKKEFALRRGQASALDDDIDPLDKLFAKLEQVLSDEEYELLTTILYVLNDDDEPDAAPKSEPKPATTKSATKKKTSKKEDSKKKVSPRSKR